ncbi:MAG: flap endonuclease-1 [Methanomicrobia archaeon]|nr:flap endonuclease-1 [Methanomicrobia archaeon]RLF94574.1 MAG: flap endonuclease-1 [Thermococci archaeon]RLF97762.1 MAG: flap endonuclease-1 [Thermococci archaeon]HDN81848.1 flap endonuclease-1 [Methanomicrobia archaeon]
MGVNLKDLLPKKEITFNEMKGKRIAIDAMNALYQFMAIIRQRDGKLLQDSKGRVTSHLSGLFYRTINLLEHEIYPVYVFDGEPPKLKQKTLEKRKEVKEKAVSKLKKAKIEGKEEEIRKYAQATVMFTGKMIDESKRLLEYMGVPYVQAPSEGEAQASYMTIKGDVWATGSQDFDSLLFGAPRLIRNLTISGRRKLPGKNVYREIFPEIIVLKDFLKENDITREQLVEIGILVGTDFNEGIKGIGPKKALKSVKSGEFEDYEEIKEIFLNPKVTDEYKIKFKDPIKNEILEFLCEEREFSSERVERALERLKKSFSKSKQRSLDSYF